jgi:hypothetical protein
MKHKKRALFRERNHLALHPLLYKSGVHDDDNIDVVRMRERKRESQRLRQTDWSAPQD